MGVIELLARLKQARQLSPDQYREAERELAACQSEHLSELVGLWVQRGWLSPFQSQAVLSGRIRRLAPPGYVLLDELAPGGLGRVYRAVRIATGMLVAFKVLEPYALPHKLQRRFQQEGKALTQLRHPHVIRLLEVGQFDGAPFLVSEFVPGRNLQQWTEQEPHLNLHAILRAGAQAAAGLEYAHAHRRRIHHRAIKPSNLLVSEDGVLKILDFGLAMLVPGGLFQLAGARETRLRGTADFMAPEQMDAAEVDGRADIYSLGCVLFYLLERRPPYSGGLAEIFAAHRTAPLPELSVSEPLRGALQPLLNAMTAKNPLDRIQTMTTVRQRLDAIRSRFACPPSLASGASSILREAEVGCDATLESNSSVPDPREPDSSEQLGAETAEESLEWDLLPPPHALLDDGDSAEVDATRPPSNHAIPKLVNFLKGLFPRASRRDTRPH
jgi:serine/threonine-protein kinase